MSKTHTVAPGTVLSTFKNFDLADYIEEIAQPYLAMQVAQSYAWRIDMMIVSAVRTLFKTVRDEARTSELDTAADMNNAMAETAFAEACFNDIGSDSWGSVRAIHELLDLRPRAHAMARQATGLVLDWKGQTRNYIEPAMSDLFHNQGTMKPKADTLVKMKNSANRRAATVATGKEQIELATKLYERKVAREKGRLASMGEALKAQAGGLETMFNIALQRRPERMPAACEFYQIDREGQRMLIANTISASERAEDWAESDSNVGERECDDICMASDQLVKELKKVLISPTFNCGVDGNAPTAQTRTIPMIPKVERPAAPVPTPAKPKRAAKPKAVPMVAKTEPTPKKPKVVATQLADLGVALKDMTSDVV